MKLLPLPLLMLLSPSALAGWTLPGFPAFDETAAGLFASQAALPKGQLPLRLYQDNHCWQPAEAVKLNQTLSLQPCGTHPPVSWRQFRAGDYQVRIDTRSGTPTLQLSLSSAPESTAVAVRRRRNAARFLFRPNGAGEPGENHAAARRRQRRPVAAGIRRHGETGGVQLA